MAEYKFWKDAIVRVLGDADKALTINDIDGAISANGYYSSTAKDAKGRKDTINSTLTRGDKKDRLFVQIKSSTELDKYELSDKGKKYYKRLSTVTDGDVSKSSVDMKSSSESEISQEIKIGNLNVVDALKSNHNIILHGAPGTGKTYLAREIAKVMCGVDDIKKLEKSGQFKMVQFHPSYDYTDFVEGLRPTDKNEKGEVVKDIHFVRTDGIFKAFCNKAVNAPIKIQEQEIVNNSSVSEDLLRNAWTSLWNEIKEKGSIVLKNKDKSDSVPLIVKEEAKKRIYFNKKDGEIGVHSIDWDYIKKAYIEFGCPNCTSGKQIGDKLGRRQDSTVWAVYNEVYRRAIEIAKVPESSECNATTYRIEKPKFIFLIDEINRGDMSKIFGELFFSIDPGYRVKKGEENEAIMITTQYQNLIDKNGMDPFKNGFYIPDNVYIIGTMNDIDRSVESMDFAMRRRFQFIEVKPEHRADDMGVKKDSEAHKRMTSLNNCISGKVEDDGIGLSAAYHIGPSYFMKLAKDEESVIDLWNYRLKGLLREYLRGEEESKAKLDKLKKAFGIKIENGVDVVMPV